MNYRAFLLTAIVGLLGVFSVESAIVAFSDNTNDPVVVTAELQPSTGDSILHQWLRRRGAPDPGDQNTRRLEDAAPPAFEDPESIGAGLIPEVAANAALTPEQYVALIEIAKLVIPLLVGWFGGNGKLGGIILTILNSLSSKLEGSSSTRSKK